MEFKSTLQYLLENKYIVLMNSKPVVTVEFENKVAEMLQTSETKLLQKKTQTKEYSPYDKKEVWNRIINECNIPWRVKTNTGQYTVRQYSIAAANKLIKILSEYENTDKLALFMDATRNYYQTVTSPILFSRYLNEDYYIHEMEYLQKNKVVVKQQDGSSKFED